MPCILKTVGDLKKALERLDDSTLLTISAIGCEEEVNGSVTPLRDKQTLEIRILLQER